MEDKRDQPNNRVNSFPGAPVYKAEERAMKKHWLGIAGAAFLLSLIETGQTMVWAQSRVKLTFTPESARFNAATEEYRQIWQSEGDRMIAAIEQLSGLKYPETEVRAIVFEGPSESGFKETPMKMRASYSLDIKKATLMHEIGHRHLTQLRKRPAEIDEHRLLFLWLYEAWVKLYGQAFADDAVKVESARKGLYDYESAWKWALAMTPAERAAKFQEIKRQN